MNGLRQIMTPGGPILVSDEEAASLGFADPTPPPQEFGTPALAAPEETPVPDVAFQPPPANLALAGGMPPIAQETASTPVSTPAKPESALAAPAGADAAPAPASNPAPAPQQPAQPLDLSKVSHGDIVQAQQANLGEQAAAQGRVGEKEAQSLEAQAAAMEQRNQAIAAKEKADADAQAAEQAAIAQKAKIWEAKNDEWMNAKVTRRGISTGELIGMAIAGLGSALKGQGAQNPAIPIVMAKIQQDVDDQIRERDELGKRAGAAKGALDYARDIATDAQAQRMAATGMIAQRYAREIETVAAKMAPGIKREQVQAQAAELKAQGLNLLAQGKERQDQVDNARLNREQQERESRRQAAQHAADRREQQRQFDLTDKRARDLAAIDYQKEIGKAIATGDVEKAKLLAAQEKEERELAVGGGQALKGGPAPSKAMEAMNKLNQSLGLSNRIERPGFDEQGRLLQPDGTVFKAPDTVEAGKLRELVSSTITSQNLIDKTLRLIKQHGWESDLFKDPEFLQMKSTYNSLILEGKTTGKLGVLAGPDMGIMDSIYGGDPTQLRDPSEALRTARANVGLKTQNDLAVKGYAGNAFVVPDAAAETKAPRDRDVAALVSDENAGASATEKIGQAAARKTPNVAAQFLGQEKPQAATEAKPESVMSRNQELALGDLVKRAGVVKGQDGKLNPDADVAVSGLIEAAQYGQNKAARDAAAQALVDLAVGGNPIVGMRLDEFKRSLPSRRNK